MQGKVIARSVTKFGKLHFSIEITTKPASADGKQPAEVKTVNAVLEMLQVQMAQLIGSSIPGVSSNVVCQYTVNTATGAVSDEWVTFGL